MGRIFDGMKRFFDEDDWHYEEMSEGGLLRLGFRGDEAHWTCYAQAREEQEQFVFYSVAPVHAPPERLAAVAEFVCRANYNMVMGNFELDFSDGEVRYKTSIDLEGLPAEPIAFKNVIYPNVLTMDRYVGALMAVIGGGVDPGTAIAAVERVGEGAPN